MITRTSTLSHTYALTVREQTKSFEKYLYQYLCCKLYICIHLHVPARKTYSTEGETRGNSVQISNLTMYLHVNKSHVVTDDDVISIIKTNPFNTCI